MAAGQSAEKCVRRRKKHPQKHSARVYGQLVQDVSHHRLKNSRDAVAEGIEVKEG